VPRGEDQGPNPCPDPCEPAWQLVACPASAPKKDRSSRRMKSQARKHRHRAGGRQRPAAPPNGRARGSGGPRHLALNLAQGSLSHHRCAHERS